MKPPAEQLGRLTGAAIQAAILGTLLFIALFRLAGMVGGTQVFRYEGF